jgi:hypothetical protein
MADWLVSCGVTTAAMESTGVYWIPVYDVLEQHGIKPCLVNPRNMKNVPGKRTDFHECQWIQPGRSMIPISISAIFSQLACLGV